MTSNLWWDPFGKDSVNHTLIIRLNLSHPELSHMTWTVRKRIHKMRCLNVFFLTAMRLMETLNSLCVSMLIEYNTTFHYSPLGLLTYERATVLWVFTNTVDLSEGNKGRLNIISRTDGNNMSVDRGHWWSIVRVSRCDFTASCIQPGHWSRTSICPPEERSIEWQDLKLLFLQMKVLSDLVRLNISLSVSRITYGPCDSWVNLYLFPFLSFSDLSHKLFYIKSILSSFS